MITARAVLVVDDDELIRTTLSRQLQELGITVVRTAEDGQTARRALDREAYDIIISDLMLPGMDGVEFLREVARAQPHAALILISALDERIVRSVALLSRERGLKVLGAIRKPIRQETLRQLLESRIPAPVVESPLNSKPRGEDVLRGLESQDISLRVQPMLRASDQTLHCAECLLQWGSARMGAIAPQELIRVAEKTGLTHTLAEYSLDLALRHSAAWARAGVTVPVSVNLSAAALRRLDLPDRIDRLVRLSGLAPSQLTIEISERSLSDEPELLDVLTRLRMREVRVALDNYISGYSSLLRLQRLPINEVKIDRSFIRCLGNGVVATTIVEYSIKMAKALGLETIAVGVESAQQAEQLQQLGCDVLQGNFIAPPMAADELVAWSKDPKSREAKSQETEAAPSAGLPLSSSISQPEALAA